METNDFTVSFVNREVIFFLVISYCLLPDISCIFFFSILAFVFLLWTPGFCNFYFAINQCLGFLLVAFTSIMVKRRLIVWQMATQVSLIWCWFRWMHCKWLIGWLAFKFTTFFIEKHYMSLSWSSIYNSQNWKCCITCI